MLITDGILRMRNRNGTDHWELMNAGTVYQVDVDLWSTSYIWNTGHQIRVDISSSNYPRCLNNPNTADGIYKNTTYTIAHNTIYIDSICSSCLILPEIPLTTTDIQKNWSPSFQKNILIEDHPHLKLPERLQNILDHIPILNQISEYHPFMIN